LAGCGGSLGERAGGGGAVVWGGWPSKEACGWESLPWWPMAVMRARRGDAGWASMVARVEECVGQGETLSGCRLSGRDGDAAAMAAWQYSVDSSRASA
jgi:hypothetical protein